MLLTAPPSGCPGFQLTALAGERGVWHHVSSPQCFTSPEVTVLMLAHSSELVTWPHRTPRGWEMRASRECPLSATCPTVQCIAEELKFDVVEGGWV